MKGFVVTVSRYHAAVPQKNLPWYFEDPGPSLFNGWSFVHIGTGALFQTLVPNRPFAGLVLHTLYEAIEGKIITREDRDPSMRNHIGDTLAFTLGMWAMGAFKKYESPGRSDG